MDFCKAQEAFEHFLDGYDRHDEKINLKIVHTYGVVTQSTELAKRMRLSDADTFLAKIIALLHDIGRFEQLRRYDSFLPCTMDHAKYGVNFLFEECKIRTFLPEDTWDEIIRTAIANHSLYILGDIADPRALLHAKLIRDADKLDNCRVKLVNTTQTFVNASEKEIGSSFISDSVFQSVMQNQCIQSSKRISLMDFWVSFVAYFFDLNFRASFHIIEEEDYITRIIGRIPYSNPDTAFKMKQIEAHLKKFIQKSLSCPDSPSAHPTKV